MLSWLGGNNKVLELNSARLETQNKNQLSNFHTLNLQVIYYRTEFSRLPWKLRRWQNLEKLYRCWHSKFANKVVKGSPNDPEPSKELEYKRIAMAISIFEGHEELNWSQLLNLPNLRWKLFQMQYRERVICPRRQLQEAGLQRFWVFRTKLFILALELEQK